MAPPPLSLSLSLCATTALQEQAVHASSELLVRLRPVALLRDREQRRSINSCLSLDQQVNIKTEQ